MNVPHKILNIPKLSFFVLSTTGAIVSGLIYLFAHGLTWAAVFLFVAMTSLSLMGISCGFHRYYSHRTHEAKPWLQFCYLFFGSSAFENSCIKWASDHRYHHRHVDTPLDPYNIKDGVFWAHLGWIIYDDGIDRPVPKDLLQDKWVMWQAKYWIPIGIVSGLLLPTLMGYLLGDAWGGFIIGGVVRVVVNQHLTFMINSLAHSLGTQPYNNNNTARDSWITALVTFGEGYHNFHHWKPGDYRNGIRAFHWDPPKWFIWAMSLIKQTSDLKRTPEEEIIKVEAELLREKLARFQQWQPKLEESFKELQQAIHEMSQRRRAWLAVKRESVKKMHTRYEDEVKLLKLQFKEAQENLKTSHERWQAMIQTYRQQKLLATS